MFNPHLKKIEWSIFGTLKIMCGIYHIWLLFFSEIAVFSLCRISRHVLIKYLNETVSNNDCERVGIHETFYQWRKQSPFLARPYTQVTCNCTPFHLERDTRRDGIGYTLKWRIAASLNLITYHLKKYLQSY